MSSNENLNIGDMRVDFDRRFKMNTHTTPQRFVAPLVQDIRTLFLDLVRSIHRFRKPLAISVLAASVLAWAFIALMDPKYEGVARVSVDSNRILKPLLKGIAVQPDVDQRVKLLSQTLLNRPNLEKLAEISGLDKQAKTDEEYEELIDDLGDDVKLEGTRRKSSIYEVSYAHKDPVVAKTLVQGVLDVFVQSALNEDVSDTQFTQVFLDDQKNYYETELVAADTRLAEFKRLHFGMLPDDREKKEVKLDDFKEAILEGQQSLSVAKSKLQLYKQKLDQNPKSLVRRNSSSASMQTVDGLLAEQRSELTSLQVQYTDEYPSIQQLKKSIRELEQQKRALSSNAENGGSFRTVVNPIYEELNQEYTLAEIEVAAIERQILDDQLSAERLEATLDSMPDVATEYNKILRGNESLLKSYHEILKSRESARISKQIGADEEDVNFKVVDPPFVSSSPVGPGKLILGLAAFVALGAIGIAVAFVVAQFSPVFYDIPTIEARTGRTVIGTVGRHDTQMKTDDDDRVRHSNAGRDGNPLFLKLPLRDLHRAGIITPMTKKGKLTEEYRRIKRPLLKKLINEIKQPVRQIRDHAKPTLKALRNQSKPLLKHLRQKNKSLARTQQNERSSLSDALINEEMTREPKNVIVVTSSVSGEGKSYTAANLAMTLSIEKERTVLLIDADVIRGSLSNLFDVSSRQAGLTDVLQNDSIDIPDAIMQTNIQNLRFMSAGTSRSNTSEMLSSNATSDLILELARRYHDRIVILDCPPLLQTNEANILADLAGQVVFVVAEKETSQNKVISALEQIDRDKDVGVILNKSSSQIGSYDYHLNKYT